MIRSLLVVLVCLCSGCGSGEEASSAAPKLGPPVATFNASGGPPESILFQSGYGNVTYTHQKHMERAHGDCATCHPSVFPQTLDALNYGKARHRVAEEYKTSCAACHGIQGTAFAAERNCQRCHDMGAKH